MGRLFSIVILVFGFTLLNAQHYYQLSGSVRQIKTKEVLPFASVSLLELNIGTTSDISGEYTLRNIPGGKYTVRFQTLGYQIKDIVIDFTGDTNYTLHVELDIESLHLEEVTVTATENQNTMSSSSKIGAEAIDHIQATNLGDVLQLIPGQVLRNSDLTSSNQAVLRLSSDSDDEKLSALGTSIVLDGAPISNNADLQVTNTSTLGARGLFETVSGGGADLRNIPSENLESVEVIKGIPSAKHGDMTSGVVLVKTKTGEMPLTTSIKFNSTSTIFNIGKGIKLSDNKGIINTDLDYAHARQSLISTVPSYNRINTRFAYVRYFPNGLRNTSKITLQHTEDTDKDDKDASTGEKRYSKNSSVRFTNYGKWNADRKILRSIEYNLTLDYKDQLSYTSQLLSKPVQALSISTADTTMEVGFLPSEYLSGVYVDGRPLNIFGNISSDFIFQTGTLKHIVSGGIEWRTDINFGKGRYYEDINYPSSSTRPRDFSDIPAVNQLSGYAEDLIMTKLLNRELKIQLGLRFDNIQPVSITKGKYGQILMPRLNVSYGFSENFKWRGGYGISTKAPALVHLYPDNAYKDATSYQFYSTEYSDERLAILTTKVFDALNTNLKPCKIEKTESGFDLKFGKNDLNLTVYHEVLTNGYAFTDVLAVTPYPSYDVIFYSPGFGKPILDTVNVDTMIMLGTYKAPTNNKKFIKTGMEFTLHTGKIPHLGTYFNITGSYTFSRSENSSEYIYIPSQYFSGNDNNLIGIYRSNGFRNKLGLVTVRIIQHIPKLNLIATSAVQVSLFQESKTQVNNVYPIGYIDEQGETYYLTEEESISGAYSFLQRKPDESAFFTIKKPVLCNINFRLTKEIGKNMKFSFYVNNMFMHNPGYANRKQGQIQRQNPDMNFGGELSYKF